MVHINNLVIKNKAMFTQSSAANPFKRLKYW